MTARRQRNFFIIIIILNFFIALPQQSLQPEVLICMPECELNLGHAMAEA